MLLSWRPQRVHLAHINAMAPSKALKTDALKTARALARSWGLIGIEMRLATAAVALCLLAAVVAVWIYARRSSSQGKKRRPSGGGFAWALLFLSGGRMPPPSPQSQIEQEAGERKNREIDRSKKA
jgi:hypothetical protein